MAAFAHSRHDQAPSRRRADVEGAPERAVEGLRQLLQTLDLGANDPSSDRQIPGQERQRLALPRRRQGLGRRNGDDLVPQNPSPLIAINTPTATPAGQSSMRENVLLGPALQVKRGTYRQKTKAGTC